MFLKFSLFATILHLHVLSIVNKANKRIRIHLNPLGYVNPKEATIETTSGVPYLPVVYEI